MSELDLKTKRKEKASSEKHRWVRLTRRCNNNCIFCLDKESQNGEVVPLEEIRRQLEDGVTEGATRLILSGGEATLHPDFFEIVRLGKKLGYRRIQTVTNGRMFAYSDFLNRAIEAGLDETTFSMHGHTAELHEAQTRIPGSFKQALAGLLSALGSRRLIVNVDIVINKFNYKSIDKILDFYIQLGVREFDLLHITPYGSAWENRDKVFYDPAEGIKFLNKAFAYSRRDDLFVWTNRFPPSHLTAFPELIQNPAKIKDEVRGRMDLFDAFLKSESTLPCRGDRCGHCFLKSFCADLFKTERTLKRKSASSLRVAASRLPEAIKLFDESPKSLEIFGQTAGELCSHLKAIPKDASLSLHFNDYSDFESIRSRLPKKILRVFAARNEQIDGLLAIPKIRIYLELNADNAAFIEGARDFLLKKRIRLHLRNRESLSDSRLNDVELEGFFDAGQNAAFRIANAPLCLPAAGAERRQWHFDVSVMDGDSLIDMQKMADSFVRNNYYVYPQECEGCAKKKSCPGLHVNYYRSFGFNPRPQM